MPRAAKQAAAVEEYDENEGDFEGDDASDDWQPEPEVSFKRNNQFPRFNGGYLNSFITFPSFFM
jgi:hypothetical protein